MIRRGYKRYPSHLMMTPETLRTWLDMDDQGKKHICTFTMGPFLDLPVYLNLYVTILHQEITQEGIHPPRWPQKW